MRHLAILAVLAFVLPVVAPAQIPFDDGFQAGCCAVPAVTLPNFPSVTMIAEWGVLNSCALSFQTQCAVTLGAPIFFECDYAWIPITISGLGTAPPVSGFVLAKYARTWMEPGNFGTLVNVWRFLINGDLNFVSTPGCPAGPCLPTVVGAPWFKTAHMVGHIDYTLDGIASAPIWGTTISLSHLPGCFQHAGFSTCSVPALANTNSSYHLVGPAPFNFLPAPEPQGVIQGDSLRTSTLFTGPFFYQCHGETDMMAGGIIATANADCLCAPQLNGRWRHQILQTRALCQSFVTAVQSLPIPGSPLGATGFAALQLGSWNSTASFPGSRSLFVYIGVLTNSSLSCGPVLNPLLITTGVGTTSTQPGFLFTNPAVPPTPLSTFIDLQNMLPLVNWTSGLPTPGLGSLFASDFIASLNLP